MDIPVEPDGLISTASSSPALNLATVAVRPPAPASSSGRFPSLTLPSFPYSRTTCLPVISPIE